MIDISKFHLILGETRGNHDLKLNYSGRHFRSTPKFIGILNADLKSKNIDMEANPDIIDSSDIIEINQYTEDRFEPPDIIYINDITHYKLLKNYKDLDTEFEKITCKKCLSCNREIKSVENIDNPRTHFCKKCASELNTSSNPISINEIDIFFRRYVSVSKRNPVIKSLYTILKDLGYYKDDESNWSWTRTIIEMELDHVNNSSGRYRRWTDSPIIRFQKNWEELVNSFKSSH